MTDLDDLQRRLLAAAFHTGGCVTVIVSVGGGTSVMVGSERICDCAAPVESLVLQQLMSLIGRYSRRRTAAGGSGIRNVLLYGLTSDGRRLACELADQAVVGSDRDAVFGTARPRHGG